MFIDFHRFSSIFIDFHRISSIFIDFQASRACPGYPLSTSALLRIWETYGGRKCRFSVTFGVRQDWRQYSRRQFWSEKRQKKPKATPILERKRGPLRTPSFIWKTSILRLARASPALPGSAGPQDPDPRLPLPRRSSGRHSYASKLPQTTTYHPPPTTISNITTTTTATTTTTTTTR